MNEQEFSDLEIDLDEFSKEELITLIRSAHNQNTTFNEFIVNALKKALFEHEKLLEIQSKEPKIKDSF